ncbi:MAG: hypothetical protein IJQ62_04415 [Clostridia bacterium]|nr:hypothetical protein [Clostridia bacterium]
MKKRFLAAVLLITLLLTSLPLSAVTADSASEEEDPAVIHVLNDLINYIYQCECIYEDLEWAADSFSRYDGERTWENLQFARASFAIARLDISKRDLAELEMQLEDEIELMERGVDVSFMERVKADFEAEKTAALNTCANLCVGIMEDVFVASDWEISMEHVGNIHETAICYEQYLANTADWVLASINDAAVTERFNSVMANYCPAVHALQSKTPKTKDEIEKETDELLDKLKGLIVEGSNVVGARQHRLNVLTDLYEKNQFDTIAQDIVQISGLPLILFCPDWFDEGESYFYYWRENGEVAKTPVPGTVLARIPDGCKITSSGVTKDEVKQYQAELEAAGLPCLDCTETEEELTLLYEYEGSVFAVFWEEGMVNILMSENPVCLLPRWLYSILLSL